MQTFLPYPDLRASSVVLDDRRLGKQRVETYQILRALTWPTYAWKNHPAVRMWRGFVPALVTYGLENCREWTRRGYADTVAAELLAWSGGAPPVDVDLPPWFGLEALHLSHRSALLRKDPLFYRPLFGDEPDDLPYLWPSAAFPRWPVRSGEQALPLDEAVRLLGLTEARPEQAAAVHAVRAGRDCVLALPPGAGASTAGLLAGLALPGRTLWVTPWDGPRAGAVPDVDRPPPREIPQPAKRAAATARPPSPADLEAMADEARRPEFVFAHPDRLPPAAALDDVTLVVADRAERLDADEAAAVAGLRTALGRPPLLALTTADDPSLRPELGTRLGLVDPVLVTGG